MAKYPDLIIRNETTDNSREVVIKRSNPTEGRDTKLGDVMDFLYHGLIHKEETGLGATTLELISKRDSIIVEPIKITAYSKAAYHSKNSELALYVRGKRDEHGEATTNNDILDYINNKDITYKKILVVADSLERLVNVIGKEKSLEFFLLIDEIDSFQLDSTFRKKMEHCLNIYKQFPVSMRAMVSATVMAFSDPELENEFKTIIRYDHAKHRLISLLYSGKKTKSVTARLIQQVLKVYPSAKIMVAYNSVAGCFDIASHLADKKSIPKEDIKILCSSGSKEKVGAYYSALKSTFLPGRINFVTAAYFTGYDIDEQYHLISVSQNANNLQQNFSSLSGRRLKQIAGRCRHPQGLYSENIIYNIPDDPITELVTKASLIEAAQNEISALACIKRHYEKHRLLKETISLVREMVTECTIADGCQLVWLKDKTDEAPKISYLNIDAFLERQFVYSEFYNDRETLPRKLEKTGCIVKEYFLWGNEDVKNNQINKLSRNEQIQQIVDRLRKLEKPADAVTCFRIKKIS